MVLAIYYAFYCIKPTIIQLIFFFFHSEVMINICICNLNIDLLTKQIIREEIEYKDEVSFKKEG